MAQTAAPHGLALPLRPAPPNVPRSIRPELTRLQAIISGGQTGADQAGLRTATRLGLATGGWAPRGYRTLEGPAPWLGTDYGLIEHPARDYPTRTKANVAAADATVRIAAYFNSPGEICTLKAIKKCGKPHLDVYLHLAHQLDYLEFFSFLIANNVRILNVAGNSEQTSPGIREVAETFLNFALSGEPR